MFHLEELYIKEYVSWGGKFKFSISFELEPSPGLLEGGLKRGEMVNLKTALRIFFKLGMFVLLCKRKCLVIVSYPGKFCEG